MVELNIPLQQEARRSQERESEAMLAAARARREATANRILSALTEKPLRLEAAQRMESLSSGSLLPQGETSPSNPRWPVTRPARWILRPCWTRAANPECQAGSAESPDGCADASGRD